jgi:hypothetical protein
MMLLNGGVMTHLDNLQHIGGFKIRGYDLQNQYLCLPCKLSLRPYFNHKSIDRQQKLIACYCGVELNLFEDKDWCADVHLAFC